MRLLPMEQDNAQMRVPSLIGELRRAGQLVIAEPCNCGYTVRHNNGGNYHEIVRFAFDQGRYFIQHDSTCDLEADAEWEETNLEALQDELADKLRLGW